MSRDKRYTIILKVLILSLLLYLLGSFSFTDLQFQSNHFQYAAIFAVIALVDATVLSIPILASRRGGWRLVGAIFLVFFGVSTFLVAIEATYMSDVLSTDTALKLLLDGAINAAIFAPAAVAIYGKLREDAQSEPVEVIEKRAWWSWLWRIPLTGAAYVALFILAGTVVFRPLAFALDPVTAEAYLGSFAVDNPNAILGFQFLRGTLWAVLTIPVIAIMRGPRWFIGLTVALIYGLVMGLPNLVPNEVLTPGLRIAHTVEVFVGNFLFGWVVVWLLARPRHQIDREVTEERSSRVMEPTEE